MNTRDLAEALKTLAELADDERADDLRKFARVFSEGKEESIVARLKKLGRSDGLPKRLMTSLRTIKNALKEARATKQSAAIGAVLEAFLGSGDPSLETFILQITTPPPAPRKKAARPPPEADPNLARQLADELTESVLNKNHFNELVKKIRNAKLVNTPTLTLVANQFLGNAKVYDGRKDAIDEIMRRQKVDAREHARNKALNRVDV